MIKIVFCVKRRSDIPKMAFYDYWLNKHGPLVRSKAQDLNIKKYTQSHTINEDMGLALSSARGMKQGGFDGVAELWWESHDVFQESINTPQGQEAGQLLAEDEARFIDMAASTIFLTEEHAVISLD